jgi:hypothetical protein
VLLDVHEQADLPFEQAVEGVLLAYDGGPLAVDGHHRGHARHAGRLHVLIQEELVFVRQVSNLVHRRLDQFLLQDFVLGVVGLHVLTSRACGRSGWSAACRQQFAVRWTCAPSRTRPPARP